MAACWATDANGNPITVRAGRFGPYVQRGEATEAQPKPDRASLPKGWSGDSISLERALMLLDLPRAIGPHPEDGALVEAGIGRYGPYIKHNSTYANIPEVEEVFTIGMNRAMEVLAQKATVVAAARQPQPRRSRNLAITPTAAQCRSWRAAMGHTSNGARSLPHFPKAPTPKA
jgi:topoisomerase IA-like protein